MENINMRTFIAPLLGFSFAIIGSVATAQERTLALEEVIVTATRRAASLQDVSVAVTALPDFVLEQALAL